MKTGKTLTELAVELQRQQSAKRDFIANTAAMELVTVDGSKEPKLSLNKQGEFPISEYAHGQIASRMSIPKTYYDRMREESPELLRTNVNHWLAAQPQKQLVRTMDGQIRAFLSDSYRPYDNYDLAEQVIETMIGAECEIVSTEVTEKRFYLKAITPKVTHEIAKGDVVQAGLVISNSEIGAGSLKVEPLIYRLVCTNGMIAADSSFRKNHAGRALSGSIGSLGDGAIEFLSDDTRKLSDQAVFAQIKDLVRATLTDDGFRKITDRMRASKNDEITKDVFEVIEVFSKRNALSESHGKGILEHLLSGNDKSRYGLLNAVTRYSQDVADYDTATEFERLGGTVLDMSQSDWRSLAQ